MTNPVIELRKVREALGDATKRLAIIAAATLVITAAQSQTTYMPPSQRTELLRSLPTEAQKSIENVRASCKETLEHSTTGDADRASPIAWSIR